MRLPRLVRRRRRQPVWLVVAVAGQVAVRCRLDDLSRWAQATGSGVHLVHAHNPGPREEQWSVYAVEDKTP